MPYKFNPFTGKLDNAPGAPVFPDNKFTIFDDGDKTKRFKFEASAISPTTTRTLDIQDVDGPVAIGYGAANQYIRGDATISNFPVAAGGGSSVSYYLNGSVSQGTILGNPYYQLSKTAVIGAGTNFSLDATTTTAFFVTDVSDPSLLQIPQGNFNFQLYASTSGGTPTLQVELYSYDGAAFTQIGSTSSAIPITTGSPDIYLLTISVPSTTLLVTDRLAVRVIGGSLGANTITLYTEGDKLGQMITTFSTGMAALNGLSDQVQFLATGTTGTNFNIVSSAATHTFNLPVASATNTGKLSSTDWSTFNSKAPSTSQYVVMSADAALANERVLTQGTNITVTDGGANNPVTIATVANPTFDLVEFDSTYTSGTSQYQMAWNDDEETVDIGLAHSSTLHIGQQSLYHVENGTASAINKGTLVVFAGTVGSSGKLRVAPHTTNIPPTAIMGIVSSNIAAGVGSEGYVTHFGKVRGVDASGTPYGEVWNDGDVLYADPAGGLTNVAPAAPIITVAAVVSNNASNGTLFVRPSFGQTAQEVGAMGGNVGSVDNAVLRADVGTGIVQNSDLIIDDAATTTQNNIAIRNDHSGQTNSALVLTPKGTGAFILGPKPDGTAVGGNARGTNAVDLMFGGAARVIATQVANGNYSFLSGYRSTASGNYSFCFGRSVTATGESSICIGGGGVDTGTASNIRTFAIGAGMSADRFGMNAFAPGRFAANGDAQRARFVLRNKTTTNAAVELFLDGSATRLTIPSGKIFAFTINISGVKSDGSAVAHYLRQYCLKNISATTSEVYAPVTIGTDNPAGTSIALSANDPNSALKVEVTGIAGETWRWVASVDAVEITAGT